MKLFIFLVLCFVTVSANAIIVAPYSGSYDNAGNVVFSDVAYVNVKNKINAILPLGAPVILDTVGADGILVATSASQTARPHCIVAPKAIAIGDVGSCQVYGLNTSVRFDAAIPATSGNAAFLSGSNGGYVTGIVAPVATNYPVGTFLSTSVGVSGTQTVFIRLL